MTDTRKGANPYEDMSKRTSENRPNLGLMIGGATVAVIAIIAAVVFLWPSDDGGGGDAEAGTGVDAAQNASQETASVQISGEDLPPLEESGLAAAESDPAVGLEPPTLTGESFDGSEVAIDPADGSPKLVVFLAHWCPNCQEEVPVVQEWIDSGEAPEELEIYSVSTSADSAQPNYPPSNWLAAEGWTPQVLLDSEAQEAAAAWGLPGYPYFVFVDAEGKVWQRGSGQIPKEELASLADALTSGAAPTGGGQSNEAQETPAEIPGPGEPVEGTN